MVKLGDVFEDHGEIEEILLESEFLKKGCVWVHRDALVNSCDNHVGAFFGSQKMVACFVPLDTPSDLFKEHRS